MPYEEPVETPHFSFPFEFKEHANKAHFHEVEQDSIHDVINCVTAIFLTHIGWRDESPDFGTPELTFQKLPLNIDGIMALIADQEPRAVVMIEQNPVIRDMMMVRLTTYVSTIVQEA